LKPEDRYATPRELADEIERWLADEPVQAYREPLSSRMGRWVRRHQKLTVGVGALLLTGVIALAVSTLLVGSALRKEEQARQERALAQVDALLHAEAKSVPALLAALEPTRADVLPRLRELWGDEQLPHAKRNRVALALLPVEPATVKLYLFGRMLEEFDPQEMLLLRDGLRPFQAELRQDLWEEVENALDNESDREERFRALVALAAFDPDDERWKKNAEAALEQL